MASVSVCSLSTLSCWNNVSVSFVTPVSLTHLLVGGLLTGVVGVIVVGASIDSGSSLKSGRLLNLLGCVYCLIFGGR